MTRLRSSIKPEETNKKVKPILEYNNKTYQSYVDDGFPVPEKIDKWERRFLSKVDTSKYPMHRKVTKIVRLKAIDQQSERKILK